MISAWRDSSGLIHPNVTEPVGFVQLELLYCPINPVNNYELLSSDLTRFWVIIADGYTEARRVLYYPPTHQLKTVLEEVSVPSSKEWIVNLSPSPHRERLSPDPQAIHPENPSRHTTEELWERTLLEIGIVFGSTLSIERQAIVQESNPPDKVAAAHG
jgi:hypothetical protein